MNQNAVSNQKNEISYGYSRTIGAPYSEVVARTREALRQEGFGVLCEIDLKEKLKEKLKQAEESLNHQEKIKKNLEMVLERVQNGKQFKFILK